MKTVTATELRNNSKQVIDEARKAGVIVITHRSKPDMILMTAKKLAEIQAGNS